MSEKLIVGVYLSLKEAQEAITQLEKHGFPIANVSIVAKEFADENGPSSGVNTSARETESVRDWFAERFSWILESSHFPEYENTFTPGNFYWSLTGHRIKSRGLTRSSAKPAPSRWIFTTKVRPIYKTAAL